MSEKNGGNYPVFVFLGSKKIALLGEEMGLGKSLVDARYSKRNSQILSPSLILQYRETSSRKSAFETVIDEADKLDELFRRRKNIPVEVFARFPLIQSRNVYVPSIYISGPIRVSINKES